MLPLATIVVVEVVLLGQQRKILDAPFKTILVIDFVVDTGVTNTVSILSLSVPRQQFRQV